MLENYELYLNLVVKMMWYGQHELAYLVSLPLMDCYDLSLIRVPPLLGVLKLCKYSMNPEIRYIINV